MATTTNFGWETPDDTDLVKDGAAAIRTLGQSIDTSLMDLEGGTTGQVLAKASNTDMDFTWVTTDDTNAIQNAIVDAKGDLIAATAADTPARLAVGTNGQVLTADSTAATGLAWATSPGGGMTLISTTALTSTSVLLSSIPDSYNEIWLYITDFLPSSGGNYMTARFNDDSTGNYHFLGSTYGNVGSTAWNATSVQICGPQNGGTANNLTILKMPNYANADTYKIGEISSLSHSNDSDNDIKYLTANAFYRGTAAISSIRIAISAGTFSGGSIKLYGVK
jgi:hypothetical protein